MSLTAHCDFEDFGLNQRLVLFLGFFLPVVSQLEILRGLKFCVGGNDLELILGDHIL